MSLDHKLSVRDGVQKIVDAYGSFEFHHFHKVRSLLERHVIGRYPVDLSKGLVFMEEDLCCPYEVYVAEDLEGNVLYVGEGRFGRHRHLHSGRSSCISANEWTSMQKPFNIFVHQMESKKIARFYERQLIEELEPVWNIRGKK